MTVLLLAGMALAGSEEIVKVAAGEAAPSAGVWLTEARFRAYTADSRKLPACQEQRDEALALVVRANERSLRAFQVAQAQFKRDETLALQQVQTIATLGAKLDQERQANARLRQQRNVAWGVSLGFLSAATAAVVLSL